MGSELDGMEWNLPVNGKDCSVCGEFKLISAFNQNRSSPDGRYSICRECVKAKKEAVFNDPDGFRTCYVCCKLKPLSEFKRASSDVQRHKVICNACKNARLRKNYAEETPEMKKRRRDYSTKYYDSVKDHMWELLLKREYGLSVEQYFILLDEQNGVCALCKKEEVYRKSNGFEGLSRLSIDHDHACCQGRRSCGKCVRGLLCRNCNVKLGWAESIGLKELEVYLNANN